MIRTKLTPYLQHWTSAALIIGFIFDYLAFRHLDLLWTNITLAGYLAVITAGFTYANLYERGRRGSGWTAKIYFWSLILSQFALGNLWSAFTILYSRSGDWAASWPFLLFILAVFVGTERFRRYYERRDFRLAILFISLYFFLIFHLPTVLGRMGEGIFLLAGGAALILILAYLRLCKISAPWKILGGVLLLVNLAYFTNLMPPIPLALKDAGIYHSVKRTALGYEVLSGSAPWYERLRFYPVVRSDPTAPLYAYSAVFAPAKFNTTIIHRWEYYDESRSRWQTAARISLGVSGGRDGGYRGYSLKSAVRPGYWRVSVETPRGQVLGRIKFQAVAATPGDRLERKSELK